MSEGFITVTGIKLKHRSTFEFNKNHHVSKDERLVIQLPIFTSISAFIHTGSDPIPMLSPV